MSSVDGSLGDEFRGQLDDALEHLDSILNYLVLAKREMDPLIGQLIACGLTNSYNASVVTRSVHLSDTSKQALEELYKSMFATRQALRLYRGMLE